MNNDFDLPDLKENEENVNNENNQNRVQEKIEIPQKYYDKLEKEKQERIAKQEEMEKQEEATKGSGGTFLLIIINALLIFALLFAMINYSKYIIFAIPIYVLIGTIASCSNKSKDSKFNVSILVGGMISAVVCFIVTMINVKLTDIYIYYAFASFAVAFIGYIISSIITKIMTDKENVKAFHTLLFLIIIAAIIGVPYYFYTNNKEEFMKLVFQLSDTEIANTEEEYILGTLKERYKMDFTCDKKVKYHLDDVEHTKSNERTCSLDGVNFTVFSTTYNEVEKQYIIKDGYLDELYIVKAKNELGDLIKKMSGAKTVEISFYPDNKCFFVGDCENNENYIKETNIDNKYKYSKELRLDNYLNLSKEEFINNYGFRILISIRGDFGAYNEDDKKDLINKTLEILNQSKYKNNKGYEIDIKDAKAYSVIYRVTGKTNSDKSFSNPNVETID